jgi:hypothetical protein
VSDIKSAAPEQAPKQPEAAPDLLEISRGDIAASLAGRAPTSGQLASAGRALGLSLAEVATLAAGRSSLRLTHAQYADLKAKLAKQYGQAMDNKSDAKGSICGSSGTPAPPAATQVPPVTGEHNTRNIVVPGTKAHEAAVDGGTITLRTGAQEDVDANPDNFTISYKGTDAPNEHLLQFIHREIIGVHSDGSSHPVDDALSTTGTRGGSYRLTLGGTKSSNGTPGIDNYNTDTTSSTDPFYEAGGASNRTADSTTMIDLPNAMKPKVDAAFAAGATSVVSRAHFDTYLVHTDAVTYHIQVSVEWKFASSAVADPRPTMTTSGSGPATQLPDVIRQRFHSQFPSFNFLK